MIITVAPKEGAKTEVKVYMCVCVCVCVCVYAKDCKEIQPVHPKGN